MLDIQEKTYSIAHSNLPTIEKINHIRLINKDVSVEELSSILKLNKSIIYRHIRTLKSRGTLYVLKRGLFCTLKRCLQRRTENIKSLYKEIKYYYDLI